jgi:hypothetical protein
MAKGIAVATGAKGGKMAAPFAAKVGSPFAAKAPPPPGPKSPKGMTGAGGAPAFKKGGKVK